MTPSLESLSAAPVATDFADLSALLRDAVEGGASVGFMLPLDEAEVRTYWQAVFADVEYGRRVVLVARESGRIVGSVQLELAGKPNARHRAEVQKLLVLRPCRGRGLGGALMHAVESAARARHRTLLVLDTSASGNALGLYGRFGYTRVGVIPGYARDPDGPRIDTVIYYKELAPVPSPAAACQLAQVNIARMKAPLDSPLLAGFVARLAEINALADRSPGFVWRFQEDNGNATYTRPYDDDRILFNLSVWESPDALKHFVYRTAHAELLRQRAQWFEQMAEAWTALWWVPAGHLPTVDEAKQRLELLRKHGETPEAFSFGKVFPPRSDMAVEVARTTESTSDPAQSVSSPRPLHGGSGPR